MATKPAPDRTALTREELARLSGFRLPKAAVAEGRREVVPALTSDQVRTLDRYGVFDAYEIHLENERTGGPLVTWSPRGRRGVPRFYNGLVDIATARLAAWMFNEGLTYTTIVLALRTEMIRATFSPKSLGPDSSSVVCVYGSRVGPSTSEIIAAHPEVFSGAHLFPLAWLQIETDARPRAEKIIAEKPNVWRHRDVPRSVVARELWGAR